MAEPRAEFIRGIPSAAFSAALAMRTTDGEEVFGTRPAFDLLGCCADEEQLAEKLNDYFRMVRDTLEHQPATSHR